MRVSDKRCSNCEYFKFTGTSQTIKNVGKRTGFCPFVRCVKRKGFVTRYRRFTLQEG